MKTESLQHLALFLRYPDRKGANAMTKKIHINRPVPNERLERCREINRKLRNEDLWTAKIF